MKRCTGISFPQNQVRIGAILTLFIYLPYGNKFPTYGKTLKIDLFAGAF
jgi:hypothetical protein